MTRWKLTLEYDGAGFAGWQKQANALSVQEVLEEALGRLNGGEAVFVQGAGRTDAGVHADGQVAHADLGRALSPERLREALNALVRPHPVTVLLAESVPETFHARFDARQRFYRYRILNRAAPPVLEAHRVGHVRRPLDEGRMNQASAILLGRHDFSTFRAQGCQASGPVRTLDRLEWVRDGEILTGFVEARSFLYHQVRIMVGTVALVGLGLWSLDDLAQAFKACDRTRGGPTAPAQGLYLRGVRYDAVDAVPENQ